jgi:hypothetical protein
MKMERGDLPIEAETEAGQVMKNIEKDIKIFFTKCVFLS